MASGIDVSIEHRGDRSDEFPARTPAALLSCFAIPPAG